MNSAYSIAHAIDWLNSRDFCILLSMTNHGRHGAAAKSAAKQALLFQGANMAVSRALSGNRKSFRPSAVGTVISGAKGVQAYHSTLKAHPKTSTTVGTKTKGRVRRK